MLNKIQDHRLVMVYMLLQILRNTRTYHNHPLPESGGTIYFDATGTDLEAVTHSSFY